MMLCVEGIWQIFDHRLPIVLYPAHYFLLAAKFERCIPSDIRIIGTSVSPTLILTECQLQHYNP